MGWAVIKDPCLFQPVPIGTGSEHQLPHSFVAGALRNSEGPEDLAQPEECIVEERMKKT